MNILICNDDGIESEGILALAKILSRRNNVTVVAPSENKSASGHSITIGQKLYFKELKIIEGVKTYSISGTPADCVKFALSALNFKADAVVSGINKGPNLGTDILYSGTVSAALEGVIIGLPAIAVSYTSHVDNNFEYCAEFIAKNLDGLISSNDGSFVWNINIPFLNKKDIKGIKYTKMGYQLYSDCYNELEKGIFVLSGEPVIHDKNDFDCDVEWNLKGYITVTPIILNKTDNNILKSVKYLCQM
jgi:5'-nucleotidase